MGICNAYIICGYKDRELTVTTYQSKSIKVVVAFLSKKHAWALSQFSLGFF